MIKRIIFDIDNTLICNINFKDAISNTFKKMGINNSKVDLFYNNISKYEELYNGYDYDTYLGFYSDILNIKLDMKFIDIYFLELSKLINDSTNIKVMLDSLSKSYDLVLLSNYFERSQRGRLKRMGINNYFKEYYGEHVIKPNLEVYLEAKGSYLENECLIVGDDFIKDISVPKSIGFNTCYINKDGLGDLKRVEDLTLDFINTKYN